MTQSAQNEIKKSAKGIRVDKPSIGLNQPIAVSSRLFFCVLLRPSRFCVEVRFGFMRLI
jgi:hypothetical protein